MRALRMIGGVLGSIVVLGVLACAALYVGANTSGGRRLLEQTVARLSDGKVSLAGIGGHFPDELTLAQLVVADDGGVWLRGSQLSLRWSPWLLVRHTLRVQAAGAQSLSIIRRPQPGKPSSGGGPGWVRHIDVGSVDVPRLELGAALAGTATVLKVHASARWQSGQVQATLSAQRTNGDGDYRLQLALDPGHWEASLRLMEPADGPLANLAQVPGLGALAADVTVSGPSGAERIAARIDAGTLHATASGTIDLPERAGTVTFQLRSPELSPRADLSWDALEADGRWQGTLEAPQATLHARLTGLRAADSGLAQATLDVQGLKDRWKVAATAVGLRTPGPAPTLLASAPVTLSAELQTSGDWPLSFSLSHPIVRVAGNARRTPQSVEATVEVPALAALAPLLHQTVGGRATVRTQLRMNGDRRDLSARANLVITAGPGPLAQLLGNATLAVDAQQRGDTLTVNDARLDGAALQAQVRGSWSAERLDANWRATCSDATRLAAALAGRITASGEAHGSMADLGASAKVAAQLAVHGAAPGALTAELRGQRLLTAPDVSIDLNGRFDDAPVQLAAAAARDGNGRLRLNVARGDWKSLHLEGSLSWPPGGLNAQPAQAGAANAGAANAGAERAGSRQARAGSARKTPRNRVAAVEAELPRGRLELQIARLADFEHLLGQPLRGGLHATADFRGDAVQNAAAKVHVAADEIQFEQYAGTLRVDGEGPLRALALRSAAQLRSTAGEAQLTGTTTLDLTHERVTLSALQLTAQKHTVRLLAPAHLDFDPALRVDKLQLGLADAVLTIAGEVTPQLDLQVGLRGVTPALFKDWLPALDADGQLSAEAKLMGTLADPHGQLQLTAAGLHWRSGAAAALPPGKVQVSVELQNRQMATATAMLQLGGTQLHAMGAVPLTAQAPLDVHLEGAIDLAVANGILEAGGQRVRGQGRLDGTLTGTAAAPQMSGTLQLSNGELQDYVRGVHLTDIRLAATAQDGTLTLTSLDAKAGSGSVNAKGTLGLLQPGQPVQVTLSLHDAQPVASDLLTARLDAALALKGSLSERLDATGRITVSHAEITLPSALPPSVAVLDVRRPGQKVTVEASSRRVLGLDITVDAPRAIFVRGRGLDAEVGGQMHLGGTQGLPQVSGGFDLRNGRFNLVGKTLEFESGRVSFNGEGLRHNIDPTLDFAASSSSGGYTATLKVGGYADAPTIALSSSPELPQDEVLARLLFGTSVSQLTALQLAQMGAAVATVAGVGGGGGGTLSNLQRRLGLDRLAIGGGGEGGGATLEAGRYVSSRVYVGTKQSTTGSTQAQVEVDLSRRLKMQTTLGTGGNATQGTTPDNDPGSSVGLSYEFEY
jgi:translocation and assembly module TamB